MLKEDSTPIHWQEIWATGRSIVNYSSTAYLTVLRLGTLNPVLSMAEAILIDG